MTVLPRPHQGRGRRLLAQLVAIGLGQAAAAVVAAVLTREAFHSLLGAGAAPGGGRLAWITGGIALAGLAMGGLRAGERVVGERLGQRYAYAVRSRLLGHAEHAEPRALEQRASGAVLLRFVGDVTALRQWVSLGIARLVAVGTFVVATLAALAVLDPAIAVAVAAALLAGGAAIVVRGAALRAASLDVRRRRSRLAALVGERLRTTAVTHAYGQGERERRRARRRARRLRDAMISRARVSGQIQGAAAATSGVAHAAALLAGVLEVQAGRASAGTVVVALLIAGVLAARLPELGRVQELRQAAIVGRAKAEAFLELPVLPPEPDGAPPLPDGPGRLELEAGVVEPGEVVALTGPNGSGKTTLLMEIAGLLPFGAGARIDGADPAAHSRASVREAIGITGPDLPLLRGTVEENVRYRLRDAPDEELARVRELCRLDDLYADLPQGGATRIGEGGRGLSAGQRQRVALARAILGRPRVLLLDEADAHLDDEGAAVLDAVLDAHEGAAIVVTHDPGALRADRVWELSGGGILERVRVS